MIKNIERFYPGFSRSEKAGFHPLITAVVEMRDYPRNFSLFIVLLLAGAAIPASSSSSELDPISAECLTCHDGSGGPYARYCLLEQMGKGCGGHIVSVRYAEIAARDKKLRPAKNLRADLPLYDGKITCVTCHGTEAHEGVLLIIDNTGSALCRSCHLK